MADLKLKEQIKVPTNDGTCEIQLLFGSVTKLPKDDKVDVLVVSAAPGSYMPTPGSVIHALDKDLGVSMKALSKDKEEDLRKLFSCWWSKPLRGDNSFDRILCFEGGFKKGSRPPMVVGEVFRSLVSLCKDKEIKVMMPLLATGFQKYSESLMLRLIVEAAIHWMQIGLPLKVLKIVIYAGPLDRIGENPLLAYFKELKARWNAEIAKDIQIHPINYDVYLSYSLEDKHLAEEVRKYLTNKFEHIRIYADHQNINPNESWQEEIYQVMVTCARVITILSPRFLADESCLEQYNIALCCTRNIKRDYLAPFYVDSIDEMPTYMCLIQYVDCRPMDFEKISSACSAINDWLKLHMTEIQELCPSSTTATATNASALMKQTKRTHYDVFISYSHNDTEVAQQIHKQLKIHRPDWNIFIDVAELKTGVAWQIKLYESIESANIFIALLSPSYVKSKVCQEEYNLASAMFYDAAYDTLLFPVLVENIDHLPVWCQNLPSTDLRDHSKESLNQILREIRIAKNLDKLEKQKNSSLVDVTSKWRSLNFLNDFACIPNINIKDLESINSPIDFKFPKKPSNIDVVLCYHKSNESTGKFLQQRLKFYLPNLQISLPQESKVRHAIFDEADLVVPLLSSEFTKSAELSEELNTALCRQRFSNKLVLFPIFLEDLLASPTYVRLLVCFFSRKDEIWENPKNYHESTWGTIERCLDMAARFIALISVKPKLAEGSFKTLLSIEELLQTSLRLKLDRSMDSSGCNPIFFD